METAQHLAGSMGTACFCLYGYDGSLDQGTYLFAFRSQYGGRGFLEDRPLSPLGSALISGPASHVWFYLRTIPVFLGQGKAVYKKNGKDVLTQLNSAALPGCQLLFVVQKTYLCGHLKRIANPWLKKEAYRWKKVKSVN